MSAPIWFTKGAQPAAPAKAETLPAVMPKAAPGKGIPEADRLPERPAPPPAPAAPPPAEPTRPPPAMSEEAPAAPAPPPVPAQRHVLNGASTHAERPRAPRGSMPFPSGSGVPASPPPVSTAREMGCPAHDAAAERSASLRADEAARLLVLAEQSLAFVETALKRAGSRDVTAAEAAAGRSVQGCMDDLVGAVGPVNRAVDNLRAAARDGGPATLTAAQAAALETFAKCALDAADAARAAGNA